MEIIFTGTITTILKDVVEDAELVVVVATEVWVVLTVFNLIVVTRVHAINAVRQGTLSSSAAWVFPTIRPLVKESPINSNLINITT